MERERPLDATAGPGSVLPPRRADHSAVCVRADGLAGRQHAADLHSHQVPVYEKVSCVPCFIP